MWNYLRETKAISPIKVKVGFFCINEDVIYSLLSYCLCLLKCIKNRKITLPFHLNVQAYTSCITFLLISTLIYELKGHLESKSEIYWTVKNWVNRSILWQEEKKLNYGEKKQCTNKKYFFFLLTFPSRLHAHPGAWEAALRMRMAPSLAEEFTWDSPLLSLSLAHSPSLSQLSLKRASQKEKEKESFPICT